jgi:hypothetical protein
MAGSPAKEVPALSASLPRVALVTGSGKKRLGWSVADALAG